MPDFMTQLKVAEIVADPLDRPPPRLTPDEEWRFRETFNSVNNMLYGMHGLRLYPRDPRIPLTDDFELPPDGVEMRAGDIDALIRLATALGLPLEHY